MIMRILLFLTGFVVLCLPAWTSQALADGMVFTENYYAKVEIPNQQALIHFSKGVERLVIETSFLSQGTNFAWIVPLPSVPEIKPVSENFFVGLQQAFQPALIHQVNPYYAGLLFVCGLAFLGARALKDEVSFLVDLPWCLLLAGGAGVVGGHVAFAVVALGLALSIRLFARAPTTYALILLLGTSFGAVLILSPNAHGPHIFNTMGTVKSGITEESVAGVQIVSVQHAGIFESTTIRGRTPRDILEWLQHNGYQTPKSAENAIRQYVDRGWVFVASKAHVSRDSSQIAALHPLAFIFPSSAQVYPTVLTAVANGGLCDGPLCIRRPPCHGSPLHRGTL